MPWLAARTSSGRDSGIAIAPSWVARKMRRAVGLADVEGVLVREVEEDSPAANAGIAEGDLIVEMAGKAIREPDDVYDALGTVGSAGSMTVKIVRGAEERTVEVEFERLSRRRDGPVLHLAVGLRPLLRAKRSASG